MKKTPIKRGKTTLKRSGFKRAYLRTKNPAKSTTGPKKGIRKTQRAKKMELKREVIESWGLPSIPCNRWGTAKKPTRTDILKGMLWTVFSAYIRKRDAHLPCISCSEKFDVKQAGHFVPVGGNDLELCFDEKNVNGECEGCNAYDPFHLVPMRRNLIIKYDLETVENLERLRSQKRAIKWEEGEYAKRILHYHALI